MSKKFLRIFSFLLCMLAVLTLFPACNKSADPLVQSGISSLTVDAKKERVTVNVKLNARALQAHTGEKVYLYELLPGESIGDLSDSREPIASVKASAEMSFRFPLREETHNRLYSSYVVGFADGTLLSDNSYWIENPQALADCTEPFAWSSSPKGLVPSDGSDAMELGAMHAMFSLSFSAFTNGTDTFIFDGTDYSYSAAVLTALDKQILDATNAGLQVSLTVEADAFSSYAQATAVLDFLAMHYHTGENGTVSAFFMDAGSSASAAHTAVLCRLANQALRSRCANGRVYAVSSAETLDSAKVFFSDVSLALAAGGEMAWGASVKPAVSSPVWEGGQDALSVQNLAELSSFLFSLKNGERISWFAVSPFVLQAESDEELTAAFVYAYRMAASAKAGLIFYGSHMDDATGIRTEAGKARRMTAAFETVDSGLCDEDKLLCKTLLGDAWETLPAEKSTRTVKKGTAGLGTAGLKEQALFDFSKGDCYGFTGIGSITVPELRDSSAFSTQVLYTWLRPQYGTLAGVRKVLANASALDGAVSMSVCLLTQVPDADSCRVRLRLDGLSSDGTLLTYTADTEMKNQSWQTVTFQIADFVAEADLSGPCVMTLTVEPDVSTDTAYVLWVRDVYMRCPSKTFDKIFPVFLILIGAALGFVGVIALYRRTSYQNKKNKRRRQ